MNRMIMLMEYAMFAFCLSCFARSIQGHKSLGSTAAWIVMIYLYALYVAQFAAKERQVKQRARWHRPTIKWDWTGWNMLDKKTGAKVKMPVCIGHAGHHAHPEVTMLILILGPLNIGMIIEKEEPPCKSTPTAPAAERS